jgi:hypothetical protein
MQFFTNYLITLTCHLACTTGGELVTKEHRRLEPNEECDLQALILSEGEEDNELHIYDTYGRELLTLCFKVNTSDVGSSAVSQVQ